MICYKCIVYKWCQATMKNMKHQIALILLTQSITLIHTDDKKPPHIIVIVIDDLGRGVHNDDGILWLFKGWNDVSWHNPDSMTVHLGKYARYVLNGFNKIISFDSNMQGGSYSWSSLCPHKMLAFPSGSSNRTVCMEDGTTERSYREIPTNRALHQVQAVAPDVEEGRVSHTRCWKMAPWLL